MKTNFKHLTVFSLSILILLFSTINSAADTEWKTFPKEGETETIQIGESVYAGNYYTPSGGTWFNKYELLYTGCEGKIIHFTYRMYEYINGGVIIKDAFSLPLSYDLSKGKIVGYLKLRMEILYYDNISVKVKMIKQLSIF